MRHDQWLLWRQVLDVYPRLLLCILYIYNGVVSTKQQSEHNMACICKRFSHTHRSPEQTKLLSQQEPQPVISIFPVQDIPVLDRFALVPWGVHGTIPYDWNQMRRPHYPREVCYNCDNRACSALVIALRLVSQNPQVWTLPFPQSMLHAFFMVVEWS